MFSIIRFISTHLNGFMYCYLKQEILFNFICLHILNSFQVQDVILMIQFNRHLFEHN